MCLSRIDYFKGVKKKPLKSHSKDENIQKHNID